MEKNEKNKKVKKNMKKQKTQGGGVLGKKAKTE